MVNNLGGTSVLELNIVARAAITYLSKYTLVISLTEHVNFHKRGRGAGKLGKTSCFPYPLDPCSRPVFVGSCLFALFRLQIIVHCCIISPYFTHFLPPWETGFMPPLLLPPVHLLPPSLPGSCPPVPLFKGE